MEEEYSEADEIASEIRLLREDFKNSACAFLLVEGSTDKHTYQWIIAKGACQIMITGGKENAIKVLAILEGEGILGVLAIVDADFMVLEEEQPSSPNLLLTDTHDLEMMIFSTL